MTYYLGGSQFSSQKALITPVRSFFLTMLLAALAVEVVGAIWATTGTDGFKFLLLNSMLGGAAGLVGGVAGFIFGIPRAQVDANNGPISTSGQSPRSRPNTNLEQISDWLTKILVGASLTSLIAVPGFLRQLADHFDKGVYANLPGGGTLAVFIIVYFAALGFFWSYVETRTLLTELFDAYNGDDLSELLLKVRSAPRAPGSMPISEDTQILNLPPDRLNTSALLDARAAAETRARHYSEAEKYYRKALELDPGNPQLQNYLGMVLAAGGDTNAAAKINEQLKDAAKSNPGRQSQLEVNDIFIALYQPPPEGFTRAIEIGEKLLQGDQASNGQLQFWMACAYAQRLWYNLVKSGKEKMPIDPSDPDRLRALKCLQEMKRLSPGLLSIARALWHPTKDQEKAGEDDLSVFSDDPDFAAVLG